MMNHKGVGISTLDICKPEESLVYGTIDTTLLVLLTVSYQTSRFRALLKELALFSPFESCQCRRRSSLERP